MNLIQSNFIDKCNYAKKLNEKQKDYILTASLFLMLKDKFSNGISTETRIFDRDVDCFARLFVNQNGIPKAIKRKALYLLGLTLGRESTYKYVYVKENLPLVESKSDVKDNEGK